MSDRKRERPDDYFKDWKQREALAEGMIPMVGRLSREKNVKCYIYGKPLVNRSVYEIMKDHRYVRQVEGNELSEFETFPVFNRLSQLDLGPAHVDVGRLAVGYSVDGVAHIIYNNGQLFRASVEDADCELAMFQPNQMGFQLFGMGYAANDDDFGETLYVAQISFDSPSLGLASIDTDSYELNFIGPFSQNPGNALELTPTGDGPLWGYFLDVPGPGGTRWPLATCVG